MKRTILILAFITLAAALLAACGAPQGPPLGRPGQVSLVFFYTDA